MVRRSIFLYLTLLFPLVSSAQAISPAQLEQFQQLPRAQQQALAARYGVDLNQLQDDRRVVERPHQVEVVSPVSTLTEGEQSRRATQDEHGVREAVGELRPFGYDLFAGSPTTFAPVTEIPVPAEYTVGPGDVLRVQMWGQENRQLELPVSRDGTISFPQSGPMAVAGMRFERVRQQIRERVSEQYIGVEASVSLGELRSMRVFVLGEARNPGSYTVSSLSTITNVLYVSGGVTTTGSLRQVQHKRDGKLLGTLDLYDLLLKGDTSGDSRLQPGDVVFIPPVGKRVGIDGQVNRPALYELRRENALGELLSLAGGLTPQAYPQRVSIQRTNEDFHRVITEADASTPEGLRARVQLGDLVTIPSVSEITGQYVEMQGAVTRAGRYAWVPGMRVSSVISNLGVDLLPAADRVAAVVVRTDKPTDTISVLTLNLRDAVANPGSDEDLLLMEADRVLVFSDTAKLDATSELAQHQSYSREAMLAPVITRLKSQGIPGDPQQVIRITGPVRYPGEYPMPESQSMMDAITIAGGLKDSASLFRAEIARSAVDRDGMGETNILNVNLAEIMAGTTEFTLQSRDTILIQAIPAFAERRTVTLAGEIRYPGEYTFRDGETLQDILQRAGGLTPNAFPEGAVFTRAKLRELEARRLREAEERLQGDLLGLELEGSGIGGHNAERLEEVQGLLEDVQNSRAVGRMVIDLSAVVSEADYQAIRLQDGDALIVPDIPQSVSVFGEVQFPTSHLHQPGLSVDDYLERSGGPTRQADTSRVYVIRADGSVMMPETSRWFGGRGRHLQPGDTIIMPIDVDRLNQLELWTNVSQIMYQMALGAAAVGSL
ncbi:protein involved in polysaccharide export, contains SLBB domain of the beta-grasp fold [Marinobacter zhejiangensis]|uniref:Protein involved in polysaccharide export, contains SLBB domain of the beta-grasp fold n=1 Tax=Marinobacter zhejiangensis TaxID=488535 RepID=A0A1I4QQ68_9GAMM|nr:SLBB domain-containing protein [Marinobacter zhejiangensis]SFM41875.1 protein involved in polysaccharide export, contains SLBB domain of the beta-grasp fold [Marinobacter zhejiangensis]